MIENSTLEWAQQTFSHAKLGDSRRTQRLVQLASDMASNVGASIVQSCPNPASVEGAYRLIRNPDVEANAIAEAGFAATTNEAEAHDLLLALEDSTALTYTHKSLSNELGHVNSGNRTRGMLAHSVLLFAPREQKVVGLIEQQRWTRDIATRGRGHKFVKRPYEEKETFKWQQASTTMSERLGKLQVRVISVCDRESDIYEYLQYKLTSQQRFVVRSTYSRCIEESGYKLHDYAKELSSAGQRIIQIAQRGGRKARKATLDVRFAPITIKVPANKCGKSLSLYYVGCKEQGDSNEKLEWHLLTSEPVTTTAQAQEIISYYEQRWLVEEFHKAWKSDGTDVEALQLQSKDNLERVAVIQAFIAIRLLQLRADSRKQENSSCESVLPGICWKLLWVKQENKPLPSTAPDLKWARITLAKLGGWYDSKRTGRPGWTALWRGWYKLAAIQEGYLMAQSFISGEM
ncbi:IS4 family transposase [uncultured Photobacterium sp.]|uniref:IS4 family transposase n=1 Tax=uncultured Photobacterium sp. TaxID=173973 RepID=UPI002620969E|nr:IS4 family transposase [uncultured Photobacterium sp.]